MAVKYMTKNHTVIGQVWTKDQKTNALLVSGAVTLIILVTTLAYFTNKKE